MSNEGSRRRGCGGAAIGAALIALPLVAAPAAGELGWLAADYVTHVGPATASPMTPEQVRFTAPRGGSVLVRFDGGHSREELWTGGEGTEIVPAALWREAEAAVNGTPLRRVDFHMERTPAAEIFETHADDVTIQADRRAGRIVHIGRCRGQCVLLDQLLAMERATDDLLARSAQQLRQQGR